MDGETGNGGVLKMWNELSHADLGAILQLLEILSILGGGGLVAFKLGRTTQRVEQTLREQTVVLESQEAEVTDLKHEVKKLSTVLVQLAVQNNRLDRIEGDIRELKHGQGYVRPTR